MKDDPFLIPYLPNVEYPDRPRPRPRLSLFLIRTQLSVYIEYTTAITTRSGLLAVINHQIIYTAEKKVL
jgi:hypothetical protein